MNDAITFNHSTSDSIKRYIGFEKAQMNKYYEVNKPDCKTLVQLAADHPEKLETINEFIKNIITLFGLSNNPDDKQTKKPVLYVITRKTKLLSGDFSHYVIIRDGMREMRFVTKGNDRVTASECYGGNNANGIDFFYGNDEKNGNRIFKKNGKWNKGQRRKEEVKDISDFLDLCLTVPIKYADIGEMAYLY